MRILAALALMLVLASAGCGGDGNNGNGETSDSATEAQPGTERGGTITVGDQTWTFVPSVSCLIHSNGVANLAGHAAKDPSLEIVIDYGGPNQITIGGDGSDAIWHAMRDTLEVEIEGQRIQGAATFNEYFTGTGESA